MAEPSTRPDPAPVLDLLNAFRSSQALFAAVNLRLFECLAAAGDSKQLTVPELADAVRNRRGEGDGDGDGKGVSVDGLDRLCRACTALGLLDSPAPGCFALTPVAATYLVSSSPVSLTGYCTHSQQVVWPLFAELPAAVASGSNVWQRAFGQGGADVFARIYSTPPDVLRFMRGMHSFASLSAQAVVTAFDLSFASTLLDLGGATGAIAAAACEVYPGLASAVVVDLPHVVAAAEAHFAPPADGPCGGGRLRWLAADFFGEREKLPQQVDLIVLSRILHDWDPPRCEVLLELSYSLLRPGGAVLVAEMLLQPDRLGPRAAVLQDLNMLCQTHGRERSAEEYAAMLAAAGFECAEGRRTGSYLDAVLARKPLPTAAS
ncbi:hypothetical protein GPECTOR_40g518 [Gonium pectorale]|uniref:O-methyltransferase domain-containing protein n=1 Tax=Gonium pectorale TaxID=33097 RepID=A0A150GAC3_GONPE|nr:hypothetical protein GPECTOR_40g518 [Gonium pectorale]|eukprot:KXZ46784.1 hypothetical protein GPECTOR_40g518 [Gonium pectorale]